MKICFIYTYIICIYNKEIKVIFVLFALGIISSLSRAVNAYFDVFEFQVYVSHVLYNKTYIFLILTWQNEREQSSPIQTLVFFSFKISLKK